MINKVQECNVYLKEHEGINPIYFVACYMPKALEGIQKGISVFKGLNMTEISFVLAHINEIGILRGCFNNCAHCYAEGSYPKRETTDYISRMSWKDYKDLTDGIKEINDRLGCITRYTPTPIMLFHDSDCSQVYIKDGRGKIHGWTELAKMMYDATKADVIFSTAGWYKNDKAAQQRMEQYVKEMSESDNLDYLYHFAISANPYQAMHYKAVQLIKEGKTDKAQFIIQKDAERMANVLFTVTPMLKTGKLKFITRAMSNESKNSAGLSADALVKIWERYFEELKKLYENDYYSEQKVIKRYEDIGQYLAQYKDLLYKKGIDIEPVVAERLSKIYDKDDPAVAFTKENLFNSPLKAIKSPYCYGIINPNGEFYMTTYYDSYKTPIKLNFENAHKKIAPISPNMYPEPITKEMINDLDSYLGTAYFKDYDDNVNQI
ncbi:hypothetical protein J6S88_03290 [bacterium]|nr:hypothetical protein [bacterium]